MARRRTVYPNWLGNCSNENFALFSCCEMRIVKKSKALNFRNSLCPFSPTVSLYGHENSVMTEKERSQVQSSKRRFLQKIERVTLLTMCASLEIRNFLKPLLLQIERSQLRWFGHVSRRLQEKLSSKLYLPKQMEKKTVGRPKKYCR